MEFKRLISGMFGYIIISEIIEYTDRGKLVNESSSPSSYYQQAPKSLSSYDRFAKCGVNCDGLRSVVSEEEDAGKRIGCTHGDRLAQPWSLQMLSGFVVRNYFTSSVNKVKLPPKVIKSISRMNMLSVDVDTGRVYGKWEI